MKGVKGEFQKGPMTGEMVLIKEKNMPRGRWKVGRIEEVLSSEIDGLQRAARVKTKSGKILIRPLRELYPLEANPIRKNDVEVDTHDRNGDETTVNVRRSKRKAALKATDGYYRALCGNKSEDDE